MRIAVIGGGIAGVSAAYALAAHDSAPDVVVVEAETGLAHHSTGRSAAQLIVNYGTAPIRALTTAGLGFFRSPPGDLVEHPLLRRRPQLTVGTAQQSATIDAMLDGATGLRELAIDEALAFFPRLRPERFSRAVVEEDSADIDVAGLHQMFVRGLRRCGATVATDRRVDGLERSGDGWNVRWPGGRMDVDIVVDAAGAWGDVVAALAGVDPVGLQPMRRTAFMASSPDGGDSADWALVADADHSWYVKPDGAGFLCSPADETPSEPCDARPDEIDVAGAIERINEATTLGIRSVRTAWAGLRTFAPDRSMVIGPDPSCPSFVWCVGQGGTGIQTAPAAGALVAALVLGGPPPVSGPALTGLLPDRLRTRG